MYACGLRLTEGTSCRSPTSTRHGCWCGSTRAPGGKDRVVPLAPRVLALLRSTGGASGPAPGCSSRDGSAPCPHLPPTDLQSGGAKCIPKRPIHTRGTPMRPISGTRGVAASHAGTAGPPEPQYHGPLHPLTPPTLDIVHATINALMADR